MKFKTKQNTETIIVDLCMRISAHTEWYKNGFQSSPIKPTGSIWIIILGIGIVLVFLSHGMDLYFWFPSQVYFTSLISSISPLASLIFLIYVFLTNASSSVQAISPASPTFPVRRLLKKDAKVLPATEMKNWRWELVFVYCFWAWKLIACDLSMQPVIMCNITISESKG